MLRRAASYFSGRLQELRFRTSLLGNCNRGNVTIASIARDLDDWVKSHGEGYVAEDHIPGITERDFGIQQVRAEILEFVAMLLSKKLHGDVLEIGLGNYGGTHMVWRKIFRRVVTIDIQRPLVERFRTRECLDARSLIITGPSHARWVQAKVARVVQEVDLLFIDGDHEYDAVHKDLDLYHSLVKPGGVIAFHDSLCTRAHFGVRAFLSDLEKRTFYSKPNELHTIAHSREVGITYIEC